MLLTFALLKAWPAPACNNPIFAEVVAAPKRPLLYALDRCFETALAAGVVPLVGLLAQRGFGFTGNATPSGDPVLDAENARAMGNAILVFMVVPWGIDLVLYSGLHWTYAKDKQQPGMCRSSAPRQSGRAHAEETRLLPLQDRSP